MIHSKYRNARATKTLCNILFVAAVFGCAFIVIDQPVVQNAEAIAPLIILGVGLAIGAIAGYLYSQSQSADDYSNYAEALQMGFDQYSIDLQIKWSLLSNQSYATIQNMAQVLPSQYLFFAAGSQNQVASYVGESVWSDEIEYNVSLEAQNEIAGYIAIQSSIMDKIYNEMKAQDAAMYLDPVNNHAIRFYNNTFNKRFSTTLNDYQIKYGYGIPSSISENETYFCSAMTIYNGTTIYVQNLRNASGYVYTYTGEAATQDIYFPVDYYANRISVISGLSIIYGVRTDFDYSRMGAWMVKDGALDFRFEGDDDWVADYKDSVRFRPKIFPQDADQPFANYITNASAVYGASVGAARLLWEQYKAFGYGSVDEIPAEQAVLAPTSLFYDMNQMAEMNETELALMWFSFLNWVNESDLSPGEAIIDGTQANFTNAQLVLRANITKWHTIYDSDGNITSSTPSAIVENRPLLIIPLEESITFNVSDKSNITQNMRVFDAENHEFRNLVVFKGERKDVNVSDYEIEVLGITSNGEAVDNATLERITIDEWVEFEYQDNPLVIFSEAELEQATYYLYIAGGVAGAGIVMMVIGSGSNRFRFLQQIGRYTFYGGLLALVGVAIYYYVYPYLVDLWNRFTDWIPF